MTKVSFKILSSVAFALCSVVVFTVANADDASLGEFDLDITEDVVVEASKGGALAIDELLNTPPIEVTAPVTELKIAQAPEAATASVTDALDDAPIVPADMDVLAAPAVEPPAIEAIPVEVAEEIVTKTLPEPIVPAKERTPAVTKLPKSEPAPIAKNNSIVENDAPATVVAPSQKTAPTSVQSQSLTAGDAAPNGNCRPCRKGLPLAIPCAGRQLVGNSNPTPMNPYVVCPAMGDRGIAYDVQRNGIRAYPRRECPSCGRYCENGCNHIGGHRNGPMIDPYYTLRGPRDFDDPNPRPIGP